MKSIFRSVLIIKYALVYVETTSTSVGTSAVSWKYCSQTSNHGSKISQNEATALEIMPTVWVGIWL
jgi:hypothetical protein